MNKQHTEKIIIFGGAFNPPTLAHEQIIANCLGMPGFSRVWVMPSGNRIDKTMSSTDEQRLAMLNLVKKNEFNNNPRLAISEFELNLPRPSETLVTVVALGQQFPDKEFWFVFGSDSYNSIHTWPGGAELKAKLKVILQSRDGMNLPPESANLKHMAHINHEMSSTQVRDAVQKHRSISGMVAGSVQQFIKAASLYEVGG